MQTTRLAHFLAMALCFGAGCGGGSGSSAQLPPEGATALEAWLATGDYKAWHCEAAAHTPRGPSPHSASMTGGGNRICSNDALSGFAGTGAYPTGAAAVKEIFAAVPPTDPSTPDGYAVYRKTGSGDCTSFYYYERVGTTTYADGKGSSGSANSICVNCHMSAGADTDHLAAPAGNAHDCVYTRVD